MSGSLKKGEQNSLTAIEGAFNGKPVLGNKIYAFKSFINTAPIFKIQRKTFTLKTFKLIQTMTAANFESFTKSSTLLVELKRALCFNYSIQTINNLKNIKIFLGKHYA